MHNYNIPCYWISFKLRKRKWEIEKEQSRKSVSQHRIIKTYRKQIRQKFILQKSLSLSRSLSLTLSHFLYLSLAL